MDGDKIDDLLIREGGKLTLFGAKPDGMDMEKPRQMLKSSGNVLTTILLDENDDGLKDLWLIRVEDVSLGNLFLWLAVSGSIDVENFVYKNEGQAQLDGKRSPRELAVLGKQALAIFMNAIEGQADKKFLGLSDYSRDKDHYVYDLAKVLENAAGSSDLEAVQGRKADFKIAFGGEDLALDLDRADLEARDMNDDGRDDFFVFSERDETSVGGLLLLSQ